MSQVYGSLRASGQRNNLKFEIGISLVRQLDGFEDFNILNFSKILLKFETGFKNF